MIMTKKHCYVWLLLVLLFAASSAESVSATVP